jgi:hypothetical protein
MKIASSRNPIVPKFPPVPDDGYFDQDIAEGGAVSRRRCPWSSESGPGGSPCPSPSEDFRVSGIDISRPMVDQMLAKTGRRRHRGGHGDFATTRIPGSFSIVLRSDGTGWDIDDYDVANQGLISHHLDLVDGDIKRFSVPFRYVWPSELDLMAEMVGMRIVSRHAGWDREPFIGESREHVSVWEKL